MKKRTASVSALLTLAMLAAPLALVASNPRVTANNPALAAYTGIPGAEKITGGLLGASVAAKKNKSILKNELTGRRFNELNGSLVVELQVNSDDAALLKEIRGTGATIVGTAPAYNRITVTVTSADTVLALAALPDVGLIRPVLKPVAFAGSVESGARTALRVDSAASNYSQPQAFGKVLDGTGQRVGILSDSFSALRLGAGQLSGDLPSDVNVISTAPGSDEGAAMAELVHDIAPAAAISFHTAFISESDFASGIDLLVGDGCTVIADDVIYFEEPYYMNGIVAQAAARAVSLGVPFYSAAGNFGNDAIRQTFRDVNVADEYIIPPTGKDLHKWDNGTGYLPVTVPPRSGFFAYLHWNQPQDIVIDSGTSVIGDGSQIDLNLFICKTPDAAGLAEADTVEANAEGRNSVDVQGDTGVGFGNPFEVAKYYNPDNFSRTIYVAIDHFRGSQENIPQAGVPLEFTLIFERAGEDFANIGIQGVDPHNPASGASTIWGHNVADGVMSVAAMNYYEAISDRDPSQSPGEYYGPTENLDPESFSAKGGTTTIQFDANGGYNPRTSFEPDITCVDGTNTTFFSPGSDFDIDGHPNFFGTSAAAPNAAGVVALMLELNPTLTPGQIQAAFAETAIDVTGARCTVGIDNVTGVGLIDALSAVKYVFQQYGIQTTTPAEQNQLFEFQSDAEGWTGNDTVPGYTPVQWSADATSLNITSTNNYNTLGWLKSPTFAGSAFVQPADPDAPGSEAPITVAGTTGENSLYRATITLSSSNENSQYAPVFRIRESSASFEQSNVLAVSSVGNASFAPNNSKNSVYKHYFSMPTGQSRFNLYFDVLGFDSADMAGTTFRLEEVDVEGLSLNNLIDYQPVTQKSFAGNANGWSRRTISEFGSVSGAVTSSGLELGPVNNPSRISFAFWSGPDNGGDFTLSANRLYRATFLLNSSAAITAATTVPTFRLRANDSSNQMAAIVDVNSTVGNAVIPAGGNKAYYYMYFVTPSSLIGNKVRLSFDYLYVPGLGDDPNVKLTLEGLRVDSYAPPIGPVSN